MDEARGTLTIVMPVQYKKPGHDGCYWTKTVILHREMAVTVRQAQEILERWKTVNAPGCMGDFRMGMF